MLTKHPMRDHQWLVDPIIYSFWCVGLFLAESEIPNQSVRCLKGAGQPLVGEGCCEIADMKMFLVLERNKGGCQNAIDNNGSGFGKGGIATSSHNRLDGDDLRPSSMDAKDKPVAHLQTRSWDNAISLHKHHVIRRDFERMMMTTTRFVVGKDLKVFGLGMVMNVSKTVDRFILVVTDQDRVTNGKVLHTDKSLSLDVNDIVSGEANGKTAIVGCGGGCRWSGCGCVQETFGRIRVQAMGDTQGILRNCRKECTRQVDVDGIDKVVGSLDIWRRGKQETKSIDLIVEKARVLYDNFIGLVTKKPDERLGIRFLFGREESSSCVKVATKDGTANP
mmetsp:Transcript_23015/g.53390  ORF Transcript_23015/g.53390 Transcript_23015/m.53390 type:complete len:334 (-) Transcript_23015:816-1817(-)